jgi:xylan 1,4-beta-xylosidase
MTCVKYQAVFSGGTPDLNGVIAAAHAAGVKILIGAIGDRGRATDTAYHKEFAAGLAGIAKQGADAIEVWNEPNIFYWQGTPQEYQTLYDHAVDAVKRALPGAQVAGPHAAGTRTPEAQQFLRDFLQHCVDGQNDATGGRGAPLDVVAFHAKGEPSVVDGHVRMGAGAQLQNIDRGFAITASFPEHRHKPIVIGESDPDGCAACTAQVYPQNAYRNGALYASYTAATFARKIELADRHGVNFEGALTWAFEFEDQPYFAGFRVLASNGIALPVLNVFRMFGLMRGKRLAVDNSADLGLDSILADSVRGRPDVHAQACLADGVLSVLVWHYHDDDVPAPAETVTLSLAGMPAAGTPIQLRHYRVDDTYSNAYTAWQAMGEPQAPTPEQYAALERASELALLESPRWLRSPGEAVEVEVTLPRQSVSLLQFDWR